MVQHINLDERGVAWVDNTNTKVIEIVEDVLAYGWSAEEIHFQHPHLSLAQIHAALSFYYDNQQQFDAQIAADLVAFDRRRADALDSPMRQRIASSRVVV
ncbi:MAG: DUF433 domain-containing protein [Roseiflexaceae bacterium]